MYRALRVFVFLIVLPGTSYAKTDSCLERLTVNFDSPEKLLSHYPTEFTRFDESLVVANGKVTALEYESAWKISKLFPSESVFYLTPSLFGYNDIPSVDGIIYWASGKVTNVSIKSINLTKSTTNNFSKALKVRKLKAQGDIRKNFNLHSFAKMYHSMVTDSGLIVPRKGTRNLKLKEEKLNLIAKTLGLKPKNSRKVTIAITVNHSYQGEIKFYISKKRGDTRIGIEGWKSNSLMNISHMVRNLKEDESIDGYIITGSTQAVLIDKHGYVIISD